MGIQGFFQFLNRYKTVVFVPKHLQGKTVAIDIFWFLHKSKGDMFYLQTHMLPILKSANKVYCIFDGKPSIERKSYLAEQERRRIEVKRSIKEIEDFLKYPFSKLTVIDKSYLYSYLKELHKQIWTPSPEYIDMVALWLKRKGCEVHWAPNEADDYLVDIPQVDTIITNDSDLVFLGAKEVIRIKTPFTAFVYNVDHICKQMSFTPTMWDDFIKLCNSSEDNDFELVYSLISVYKEIDIVLQKYFTALDSGIKSKNII